MEKVCLQGNLSSPFEVRSQLLLEGTGPQFEVKTRVDGSYSKTYDLVAADDYNLCQSISLSSENFYSFGFDMLLSDQLISGSITATLNGHQIL